MALHLLIDGYNLLHQIPELSFLMQEDPEDARESLLEKLRTYQRIKRHKITVVFDAWGGEEPRSEVNKKGIRVVFTAPGETADDYIKRLASKERERAIVVTSDRAIRSFVETQGAISISSRDFLDRVELAIYQELKGEILEEPPVKPSRRLPKKARQRLAKLAKL
jgi:predicted RNA-binding protein with PIN domain